jgi:hypothetical protein
MPQYNVLAPSYIDGNLIDAQMIEKAAAKGGFVVVEYDGIASDNLQLVKGDPAKIDAGHRARLLAEAVGLGITSVSDASSLEDLQYAIGIEKRRSIDMGNPPPPLHLPQSPLARA